MSSFENNLKAMVARKKKIVCAFLTLGYPSIKHTEKLIVEFEKAGVDLIELGFPFSDPLADGPTIQASSDYALQHGAKFEDLFKLVKKLRKQGVKVPILLFCYINPILHYGVAKTVSNLKRSGFQGAIIPDLTPDEAGETEKLFANNKQDLVFLIAPTTQKSRADMIAKKSKGFIYYVSLRGVTGARKAVANDIAPSITALKRKFKKPVLVGFGISSGEQVSKICKFADGVVIGSAIIDQLRKSRFNVTKVTGFIKTLVRAAKSS